MDKAMAKAVFRACGLTVPPGVVISAGDDLGAACRQAVGVLGAWRELRDRQKAASGRTAQGPVLRWESHG